MKDKIIALLKAHEELTADEIQSYLGVNVNSTLGGMVRHGTISCTGRAWVNGVRMDRQYHL